MFALQLLSVFTVAEPKNISPSPWPVGSQAGLEKNSMMKVVFAVELSEPVIVVMPPAFTAEFSTG